MRAGAGTVEAGVTDTEGRRTREVRAFAEILRGILVAALACGIVGTLIGGLGGRIVMRAAALLDPSSTGFATANGNRIGDITLGGTFALLIFGGLLVGLVAAVVWVTVAPWLPRGGIRQALASAVVAVALAGGLLVESSNPDFALLDHDLVIVAMLLAIPALFGLTLPFAIRWLDRRVRHPGTDPTAFTLLTGGLVLLGGGLVVPITAAIFFADQACLCTVAPLPLGVPLLIAGLATIATWVAGVRGSALPPAVAITGRTAVLVATMLGLTILVREIDRIPG